MRRNISWKDEINEAAENLYKDLRYDSVSEMLSDFVLKAAANPEAFGLEPIKSESRIRTMIREIIDELKESGQDDLAVTPPAPKKVSYAGKGSRGPRKK